MSDYLDKLAAELPNKRQAAKEREANANAEIEQQQLFDAAWQRVYNSCGFNVPVNEAVKHFLALGKLLKDHGWDACLPQEIEYREGQAKKSGPRYPVGRLFFLELLQLAVVSKPNKTALTRAFQRVAKLRPGYAGDGGITIEAEEIRNNLALRNANGGNLPKAEEKKPNPLPPQHITSNNVTGVAPRNAWFLKQHEARGTDTYHKPKKIQEKWWAMTEEQRAAICPDSPARVSHAAVARGISRARALRDSKSAISKTRQTRLRT